MRGRAFLKVKEGRVGFRKMTSAERYCNEEQNKIKLNDYTTTTPLY